MRFMIDNDDDFQDIGSERENVEKATIKNVCYAPTYFAAGNFYEGKS